jgi:hypothetical protein
MLAISISYVPPTNAPYCQLYIIWQASVIFGVVTMSGIMSWYFIPEEKWLSKKQASQALQAAVPGNRGEDRP